MINYEKQARQIFEMVVRMPVKSTDETVKLIEERIRKIGHVERGDGYHERMKEEHERHENIRATINEMKSKIAQPRSEA